MRASMRLGAHDEAAWRGRWRVTQTLGAALCERGGPA